MCCGAANARSQNLDTPERRAALEERLERLLGTIGNARVKDHYRRDVKTRLFGLWREGGKRERRPAKTSPTSSGKTDARSLPSAHGFAITIILALAHHPWLLEHFAEEVARLEIGQKQLAELLGRLTASIFDVPASRASNLAELMRASPHAGLFDTLDRSSAFKRVAFLQPELRPRGRGAFRRADLPLDHAQEAGQGGAGAGARFRRCLRSRL